MAAEVTLETFGGIFVDVVDQLANSEIPVEDFDTILKRNFEAGCKNFVKNRE